jgi:hypothetical protein
MSDKYILDGHQAVLTDDLIEWARWFETAERYVAQDEPVPGVEVSTVFLGFDRSFGRATPLLFETMVFGGPLDQEQERYSTWEEAEQGHQAMLQKVREAMSGGATNGISSATEP